ncbi:MAG: SH3 domain-containing protein [Caldilineaceae bacterium]
MTDTIWVAIIGSLSTIAAAGITAYFAYKTNADKKNATVTSEKRGFISILTPRDGENITVYANENKPIERTVTGKVTGFSKNEIENLGLEVEISIYTDIWYKQGAANPPVKIQNNGSWSFRHVKFAGSSHVVKASLVDKQGVERAKPCEIKVFVPESKKSNFKSVSSVELNVRIHPGSKEPILTTLSQSKQVQVLGEMAEIEGSVWVKVMTDSGEGWVNNRFLK